MQNHQVVVYYETQKVFYLTDQEMDELHEIDLADKILLQDFLIDLESSEESEEILDIQY